jgi:hypothetical protein
VFDSHRSEHEAFSPAGCYMTGEKIVHHSNELPVSIFA